MSDMEEPDPHELYEAFVAAATPFDDHARQVIAARFAAEQVTDGWALPWSW